ncbi:uncharacterized protein CC84DRAFT_1084769 [Paraphaeosphaeria sporulosa]|uniref:DNA 3'-5' helicase n=1 Tax=Paraphaeosphaeria sporulosa TaxID=1460663 RepID=A0A177CW54_9PLEO|nr:uncharacterized protein CC84DRAFT_1084769 [Paraphaeosphaeria sporulosa]OAG11100.1 hypothetical protein CC84DRAFT_1084769 [Paraphaeosphaeria sporulosa]
MSRRQMQALQDGMKGIVYCRSKAQCAVLAEALQCPCYRADIPDRGTRLTQSLEKGGSIVATSALGTGVDFTGILFILHVGMPWSMIDYCQESGQAGRSGEAASLVIIVEQGEVARRF